MKKNIITILVCIFIVVVLFVGSIFIYIQRMDVMERFHTEGDLAVIACAINATINKDNWDQGYDAFKACTTVTTYEPIKFVKRDKNNFLDRWDRPISIILKNKNEACAFEIRSAGRDGILNTDDDITRTSKYIFTDDV